MGIILGSVITAGTFIIPSVMTSKVSSWKWPDWTGIGEDKIIKTSTEREGGEKGPIQKFTSTEEPRPKKTLWDVFLLSGTLGTLAVPFLLLYLGDQLQKKDKEIANVNLREEALQSYLDRVSEVLINNNVRSLELDSSLLKLIMDIVRTRTLTILRSLDKDGERKGNVIRFLVGAELISGYLKLDLSFANLKGAKLSNVDLSRACLSNADLSNADLSNADLDNADLIEANLGNADLSEAHLTSAKFYKAKLGKAKLRSADLAHANLKEAEGLTLEQVKSAKDWNQATYDADFGRKLRLSPESTVEEEGN